MAGRRKVTKRPTGQSGGHRLLYSFLIFLFACALAAWMGMQAPKEEQGDATESRETGIVQMIQETFSDEATEEKSEPKEETPPKETALPKKAEPETKPAPKAAETKGARLAVVIDDGGRDLETQRIYETMGIPLTLAVMPNQSHTKEAAANWAAAGLPVIIHQPMESVSHQGMEPVVLLTTMTADEMRGILQNSFEQIPQAVGMNNHQGSKATTHRPTMNVVMKELAARGMWFFDSATNTTTAADAAARAYGVPYVRNELFVDNEADVDAIKAMIRKGAALAKERGRAVIIGHCRPKTAEAFRQIVPELRRDGITFVYVSELLQ